MGWLGDLSSSINFYLNCVFIVRLSGMLMKLGMSDVLARGCKVAEQILNICITYPNYTVSQKIQTPTINMTIHNIY